MTGLTWQDLGEGTGELRAPDGRPLATYHWQRRNHPYFDGLRPLEHSGVLNAHAPHDHRWHHGLWWSWKFLNNVLFWEDHPDYGGNRIGLGRTVVTEHAVRADGGDVVIEERVAWRVNVTGEDLLTERRVISAAVDEDLGAWTLDWDQTWTAGTTVRFEATPWPEVSWGGYGGLNFRAARAMAGGEVLLGEGGLRGATSLHGERAAWASYSGMVDGAENDEPNRPAFGGLALLQHPGDGHEPFPIYAFSAEDGFGFLATAPLMHGGFELEPSDSMRIRTRVAVLGREPDSHDLDLAYSRYFARAERSAAQT